MDQTYERVARIEGIDLETGAFPVTLATEGEASDGHILSIKGGQIPERMPMQVSHINDPRDTAGSLTNPTKHLKDSPPRLRGIGHIEMTGEGVPAEIRRDLAHMIEKGHVNSMSIRWAEVPGKTIRRVNLPSDHLYYIDAEKEKGPARYGLFFEEWRALEGSIVAVGADPGALIGRANETEGELSSFWRSMADEAAEENSKRNVEAAMKDLRECVDRCLDRGATLEDCTRTIAPEPQRPSLELPAAQPENEHAIPLPGFDTGEGTSRWVRLSFPALDEAEGDDDEDVEDPLEHILERLEAIEEGLRELREQPPVALEEGRVDDEPPPSSEEERVEEGAPLPPKVANPNEFVEKVITRLKELHAPAPAQVSEEIMRPREVVMELRRLLDEASERLKQNWRAELKKARGEIAT